MKNLIICCLALFCGTVWSSAQTSTPPEPLKSGLHDKLPVNVKFAKNARTFLRMPPVKKVMETYRDPGFGPNRWASEFNKGDPEKWIDYADGLMVVYIPDNYDGSEAFGVYLHIFPTSSSKGTISVPSGYQEVLREKKMIFVSPYSVENEKPDLERIARALDALATVKTRVKVDEKRIIVGGTSGGGHMAFFTQMLFPEMFKGAVSHAAQSYLPGHFPGYDLNDCKKGPRRSKVKWAVVSGNKDYNYKEIQDTSKVWKSNNMPYRFFDVPGMGHTVAPAKEFKEILTWIEDRR